MIIKTEAVVLQTRRFRESSMIVTLFSADRGRITVVARGAVRPKSNFRASLHSMAYLSTIIYWKEGRDLQNLSVAEPIERFPRLMDSLERMSSALAMIELVNASVQDEDPNREMFETLVSALRSLNDPTVSETSVTLWFMIRLAGLLGYAVRTNECGICDEPVTADGTSIPYSLPMGAPLCSEHRESGAYRMLSNDAFSLMAHLRSSDLETACRMVPSMQAGVEVQDSLTSYIRYHVEGLRKLKVGQVAAKVLGESHSSGTQ